MNVGLPGTGIGGLFYLLSVVYMLAAEIVWTCRGKSSRSRWKRVLEQTWIGVSMVVIAFLTNVVFNIYVFKHHPSSQIAYSSGNAVHITYNIVQEYPILFPFILLMLVLVGVQLMRMALLIMRRRENNEVSRVLRV